MAKSTSSSTKKAAKLAQHGTTRSIRFQGGTVFPIAVALTLILGLALIVYSRQSLPAADSTPPMINDHWHAAYGFYLCDAWYYLDGALEERDSRGNLTNTEFLRTGVHSHDDGVIHWHPYTSAAVGRRATFGVFLNSYEVELSNDAIKFPVQNALGGQQEWIEGETQCNGEDAEVSVRVWKNFTDTDAGKRYIANFNNIHIDNDGMVFAVFFTADGVDQPMPPQAQDLPALGAVDSAELPPQLLQPDGSVPVVTLAEPSGTDDTVTDDTVTDDTVTDDTVTDDTVTDDTVTDDTVTPDTVTDTTEG